MIADATDSAMRAGHNTLVVGVCTTDDVKWFAFELHATLATAEGRASHHDANCNQYECKHNTDGHIDTYGEGGLVPRLLLHERGTSDYGHNAKYCKDYA